MGLDPFEPVGDLDVIEAAQGQSGSQGASNAAIACGYEIFGFAPVILSPTTEEFGCVGMEEHQLKPKWRCCQMAHVQPQSLGMLHMGSCDQGFGACNESRRQDDASAQEISIRDVRSHPESRGFTGTQKNVVEYDCSAFPDIDYEYGVSWFGPTFQGEMHVAEIAQSEDLELGGADTRIGGLYDVSFSEGDVPEDHRRLGLGVAPNDHSIDEIGWERILFCSMGFGVGLEAFGRCCGSCGVRESRQDQEAP